MLVTRLCPGAEYYIRTGLSEDGVRAIVQTLEDVGLEMWSSRQLAGIFDPAAQAAVLDRLQVYTVYTKSGDFFPPCKNCSTWVLGQ